MIHKRGRSGGPVFFLAKNPGLWHNGQERKVQPVTSLTKRAIRASFLKLLNERPLNKITVKDIVEDCGINRNSFYYHYTDIPALAEEIVKDEAARIVQEYPTVDSLEQFLEIAVEFALQNRTAVLHLYNSASHEAYEHSLMDICRSVVGSYFDTAFAGKALPEADREVLVRFYQCECYGQIVLWMSQAQHTRMRGILPRQDQKILTQLRARNKKTRHSALPSPPLRRWFFVVYRQHRTFASSASVGSCGSALIREALIQSAKVDGEKDPSSAADDLFRVSQVIFK